MSSETKTQEITLLYAIKIPKKVEWFGKSGIESLDTYLGYITYHKTNSETGKEFAYNGWKGNLEMPIATLPVLGSDDYAFLGARVLRKGPHEVRYVNLSSGRVDEPCFYAMNAEALKEFIKDMELNVSVVQGVKYR